MIHVFTYPWPLLLLAFVPFLAWRLTKQSGGVWRFSDRRLLPADVGARARWAKRGGISLRVLGIALAILALSGPRWIDETSRIPTEGISIAMVLDVSTSMNEADFAWDDTKTTRLVGVQKLFRLFVAGGTGPDGVDLAGRPQDLLALVTFATHPETACPLTLEHQALLSIMEAQEPRGAADEGTTNPGDAVAWALHVLRQAPTRRKVLVFLTDGESNVPGKLSPRQAAQIAANLSIPVYAIDASPAAPKTKEEADAATRARESLRTLAKMTDGSYFRAQDGRGLAKAYESIDRFERDKIVSFQYRRYFEGYPWFAFAALAAFAALIGLEATYWRRVP